MPNTQSKESKAIKAILFALGHHSHMDKGDKADVLTNRTKKYPNLSKKPTETEQIFAITGKDIYESGYQWSCGTLAKSFCYVNSNLKEILKEIKTHKSFKQDIDLLEKDIGQLENIEPLKDVQIMVSTHPDHLVDGMKGHTLPCVKMGDGKWYAIEPNVRSTIKDYPKHKNYPDIPLILDEIKVGNKIHHIYQGMDVPYEIRSVLSWKEYEQLGFGGAVKLFYKHDKKTKMMCAVLETALQSIDQGKEKGRIYDFCKMLQDSKLPVKVMQVSQGKNKFSVVVIQINGESYYFTTNHNYLMMHKFKIENNKAISDNNVWDIVFQITPKKYVQSYEKQLQSMPNTGTER